MSHFGIRVVLEFQTDPSFLPCLLKLLIAIISQLSPRKYVVDWNYRMVSIPLVWNVLGEE